MRAIGYVRVSTEEQASSRLGLEAQRSAIAAAAGRHKLALEAVHVDEGVSGTIEPMKRPALARALEELRAGDVLLVAKRDRLARVGIDIQVLERDLSARDVRILSAAGEGTESEDPSSRLMRWILDGFAQYELDMIRERTTKALRAARAGGRRAGALPYGFRLVARGRKEIEPDAIEQETLRIMKQLRAEGNGYHTIARELTRLDRKPRRARWHPEGVRAILRTDGRSNER